MNFSSVSAWRRNQGFTLVELMVVISIIAVLATAGLVLYKGATSTSLDTKRRADVQAIANAYEFKYNTVTRSYPTLSPDAFNNIGPTPPRPGDYSVAFNGTSKYTGFRVCTKLESGAAIDCQQNPSNQSCFCVNSVQGSPPLVPTATPTPLPPTATPIPLPTATPTPSYRLVFVTSSTYPPNSSPPGAGKFDSICQNIGNGLYAGTTWQAWISDDSSSPATRFITKSTVPYQELDGTQIASNWTGLGSCTLQNEISIDENGHRLLGWNFVWTDTNRDGTVNYPGGNADCNNWSSSSFFGKYGSTTNYSCGSWTGSGGVISCTYQAHLYCFQQ